MHWKYKQWEQGGKSIIILVNKKCMKFTDRREKESDRDNADRNKRKEKETKKRNKSPSLSSYHTALPPHKNTVFPLYSDAVEAPRLLSYYTPLRQPLSCTCPSLPHVTALSISRCTPFPPAAKYISHHCLPHPIYLHLPSPRNQSP